MAGQGFKTFTIAEVLTAADVNGYLMQQAVMRFADDAARGSALGTAVGTAVPLAEGMVSYVEDAKQIQVYDGTGWIAPSAPPPGIGSNVVQTVTTTATNTSSNTFVNTACTATITPSSATSKVLALVSIGFSQSVSADAVAEFALFRGNVSGTLILDLAADAGILLSGQSFFPISFHFVDSPGSASPVTYTVGLRSILSVSVSAEASQVMTLIEVAG